MPADLERLRVAVDTQAGATMSRTDQAKGKTTINQRIVSVLERQQREIQDLRRGPPIGTFIAIDLTENNRHIFPNSSVPDFGWGVCRHGSGLQQFGDGHMNERVARARAEALNEGRPATDIPNTED